MAIGFSDLLLAQWQSRNTGHNSSWTLSFLLSLAITVGLVLLNSTGCFQILEWVILDQYFRLRPAEKMDSRLLLVTVDEPDISRLQEWPLSDENLAQVLTQINQYQPKAIGLDIYRDFPIPPGEELLSEVFSSTPNLIGVEKVGNTPIASPPILAQRNQVAMADLVMDNDGKVRRALLSVEIENEVKLSLGAALALSYLEQTGITLENQASSYARLGNVTFPPLKTNDGGYINADVRGYQILLNFRGPNDGFDRISISDVLDGKLSEHQVRDRIVLIGSIAPSIHDFVHTPYEHSDLTQTHQSPGVAIHAHIASQIISAVLDGRPLIQIWPTTAEWSWIFLWCSLGSGIILIPQWQRGQSLAAFISMGILILGLGSFLFVINGLFFFNGWWIPSMPAFIGLISAATVSLGINNSKLIKDVYRDELTNVLNRRAFNQAILEVQKRPRTLAIILCDIDYFKNFNDFYGHPAGDRCLRQVANSLQQAVRAQDLVTRYGGEEFAVILKNISPEKAVEIAERMCQKVNSCQIPHETSSVNPYVSISCGVATRLVDGKSALTQILDDVDQALYQAKQNGRNQVVLHTPEDVEAASS